MTAIDPFHTKALGKGVFDLVIIAGHFQRQPLMIWSHFFGRDIPFNRQDIYIGMCYRVSTLGELFRKRKEKWVSPEIVKEDFQTINRSPVVISFIPKTDQ